MKKYLLLIFGFAITLYANSQLIAPGGVKGELHWYITRHGDSNPTFQSKLPIDSSVVSLLNPSATVNWLNHYPALTFLGKSQIQITLGNADLSTVTYFTVYKPFNVSSENIIWHVKKDLKTDLVLTTSRMADLTLNKYMNYIDVVPLNPKVNTYIQLKPKDSIIPVSQSIIIGGKPNYPSLPLTSFQGLIPEIILYDRVLDWQEQIRVASYLALKYGITLSEPGASYLNSAGEKIWDGELYSKYHNNIAGVARDDSSGLYQSTSSSSNNAELLTLSTRDSLRNDCSVVWGDNNMGLVEGSKIDGIPTMLERKWLAVSHGISDSIITSIVLDTKQLDVAVPIEPVYWIAIDRTGKGDFLFNSAEFIKMNELDLGGMAQFSNIVLNKSSSGKEAFGFVVGQDILTSSLIISPACDDPNSGSIKIKIWGGKPPYELKVIKKGGEINNQRILDRNDTSLISGLSAGKYLLQVTDVLNQRYTDEYYMNNSDAPNLIELKTNYLLGDDRRLEIDAAEHMPNGLQYQWNGPSNFYSSNPKVVITNPGTFTLTCTKNGCSSVKEVKVSILPKSVFADIKVYPNPSTGIFTVKISLIKPSPVTMDVYSEDGKRIMHKEVKGFANYTFTDQLNIGGIYFLSFKSGLSQTSKKIIVSR